MKIIDVRKIGEHSGFCKELYKDKNGFKFVKVTHPKNKSDIEWFEANNDLWEPGYLIKKDIVFKEVK